MATKTKKAAGKKTPAKVGKKTPAVRKPREEVKANPAIVAYAKGLKDEGPCEVIRAVAKKFKSARRIEIEKSLTTGGMKYNLGTVRRQIQVAREAA